MMNPIPQDNCPLCDSCLYSSHDSIPEKYCTKCLNYHIEYFLSGNIRCVDIVIDGFTILNDYNNGFTCSSNTRIYTFDHINLCSRDKIFDNPNVVDWDFSSVDKLRTKLNMLLAFR